MDVINDFFGFSTIFINIIIFQNLNINIKIALIILWFIPILYFKYGSKYFNEWENFHISWHIVSSGSGLIASEVSRYYNILI
uniref:Uncharacterized protein n=1 Tax=viral metagenome TaxID=1070528 RepID=A0A6C0CZS8_9ZZZZ